MDIRDYLFNKLFFPKVAIINQPGVIYTKQDRKFGGSKTKRRQMFYFEDILVNLQLEAIKNLGKKEASDLWYKIGKDAATRIMILANFKKPPSFLIKSILNYILDRWRCGGFTCAKEKRFNQKKNILVLKGSNNIICRKTGDANYSCGGISAILSFLFEENIEAKPFCKNCPKNCKIILKPSFKKRYLPNKHELKPLNNYNFLNFPEKISYPKEYISFNELIKFGKIKFNNGQYSLKGNLLISAPPELSGLIFYHYSKLNKTNLFKKAVILESKKIAKNIFKNKTKENLSTLPKLLSAFGWGFPYYKMDDKEVVFTFLYPPFNKFGFLYQIYVLNGFLDYILGKKLKFYNVKTSYDSKTIKVYYNLHHEIL